MLTAHLQSVYSLHIVQVDFLPLGADPSTAVYRAVTDQGASYFVKLRRGTFDEASVTLPRFFSQHGLRHIITPLATNTGQLWSTLGTFTVVLYPFITGKSGYEVTLTEQNWRDFGTTLKRLHALSVPPTLLHNIRREAFDDGGRATVNMFLSRLKTTAFADSTSAEMVTFLKTKRTDILELVRHAERFAQTLQERALELVLCHADLHAGNILLNGDNRFYIVDWDNLIFAPKERDLMFIGGGQGFAGCTPEEEERLFYQGYGQVQVDPVSLAYYRFERIIQDVAVYCDELTYQTGSAEDRQQSLRYLISNFVPGGTIERAYAVGATLADGLRPDAFRTTP